MRLFIFIIVMLLSVGASAQDDAFVYDSKNKRDPMWPLVSNVGAIVNYDSDYIISDLSLEGVMMGETQEKSLAIINGRIVKFNDKIGVYQVVEITNDTVVLTKEGQKFTLKLKKEE